MRATYKVAPAVFTELGCSVKTLFDRPDGKNINLHCGSQHTEALAAEVLRQGADVGFAFDGDGDRVIAVDDKGNVLTGAGCWPYVQPSSKKKVNLKIILSSAQS